MLRRRVAPRRLSATKACVSPVGSGAPLGRAAIHRSASSNTGERNSNPPGRPAADHRRAASPNSVCCLIQPMSVCSASASRSALASNWAGSSKNMKFSRRNASGVASSATRRHTIGAKRLFREAAYSTSFSASSGGDGIRRQHEHDRVSAGDQRLQALPPILEGINLGTINQRLETTLLERRFKAVRKGHVLARIGDEDSGLRLSFPRVLRYR